MSTRAALAVSIGVLGGVAGVLFVNLSLPGWAAFLAWGCFFHSGADLAALRKTMAGNLFGVVCAGVAAVLLLTIPGEGGLWMVRAFIALAVTLAALVLASGWEPLSLVPAGVYGYAASLAALFQTPNVLSQEHLMHLGRENPLLAVAAAMVLGALFGLASKRTADALGKP